MPIVEADDPEVGLQSFCVMSAHPQMLQAISSLGRLRVPACILFCTYEVDFRLKNVSLSKNADTLKLHLRLGSTDFQRTDYC